MAGNIQALTMPKWGLTMEEGTLAGWDIAVGDSFAAGDEVAYIETSKIAGALEAPFAGTLQQFVAEPGETLPVGALLAVAADSNSDSIDIDAFIAEFQANFVPPESAEEGAGSAAQVVDLQGRNISYSFVAPDDPSGSDPVVLLHGFGGDANSWLFNLTEMSRTRPVYALDLPGHGASSKDVGDGSLETLTKIVLDFIETVDIGRAHLVAHSMSGALALALALDHPERVASLSLLAPCGLGDTVNERFIEGLITSERRKDVKPVLQLLFADSSLVTRDLVEDMLKFKRIDGVTEALRTLSDALFPGGKQTAQFRDRLANLSQPTLAIWGAQDQIVSADHAEGLPPSVATHVLDATGHMPHMEAAQEVNRLLATHLDAAEA